MSDPNRDLREESLRKFLGQIGSEIRDVKKVDDPPVYATPEDHYETEKAVKRSMTESKKWSRNFKTYWGTAPTSEKLPAGMYHCGSAPSIGFYVDQQDINTDNLLELPDDAMQEVFEQFDDFWKLEQRFRDRGLLYKRGYLFWGDPGGGKTSATQLLIKRVVKDLQGIVVICDHPGTVAGCLRMLRQVEPTRPLLVIMEDLDALIEKYGEPGFLSLLDGEQQIDNVIFVASTNYPGRLPQRLIDRPSRFDVIREIGMPSPAAREAYLRAKETSLSDEDIEHWVDLSDGFSIAHLKEMIVGVKVFGQKVEEVVQRLREMGEATLPTESTKRGSTKIGMIPQKRKAAQKKFQPLPIPTPVNETYDDGEL